MSSRFDTSHCVAGFSTFHTASTLHTETVRVSTFHTGSFDTLHRFFRHFTRRAQKISPQIQVLDRRYPQLNSIITLYLTLSQSRWATVDKWRELIHIASFAQAARRRLGRREFWERPRSTHSHRGVWGPLRAPNVPPRHIYSIEALSSLMPHSNRSKGQESKRNPSPASLSFCLINSQAHGGGCAFCP